MNCDELVLNEATQMMICVASNSFWWVPPLVIGVSGFVAACIALRSMHVNREIARKRATLDIIERSESTDYYQKQYNAFTQVRKDEGGFAQLKSVTNPQMLEQRKQVINYLNHYELIAIGIQKGILDEGVYKEFMKSTVVRDWLDAEGFIKHIRTPTVDSGSEVTASAAYSQFEKLALKWKPEVALSLPVKAENGSPDK